MPPLPHPAGRPPWRRLVPPPVRSAAARLVAWRRAGSVARHLAALARQPGPIVVGPWLGEIGFELLYWVPFVRWFAEVYGVAPERLVAVTRGGAAIWYSPVAARALDVLDLLDPDAYRAANAARARRLGEQKQVRPTPEDDLVLARVRQRLGTPVAVLHPAVMYRLFAPYWWGHESMEWVRRRARFTPLERPPRPEGLPASFTAVKFYFSESFPRTAANQAFVDRTVARLSEEGPVVALSSGPSLDDHAACEPRAGVIETIGDRLTPQTNLLVQSSVVAHARRFVGTYGGFAYLAPSYGVPSEGYYSNPGGFSRRHLDLARLVLTGRDGGELLTIRPVPEEAAP